MLALYLRLTTVEPHYVTHKRTKEALQNNRPLTQARGDSCR